MRLYNKINKKPDSFKSPKGKNLSISNNKKILSTERNKRCTNKNKSSIDNYINNRSHLRIKSNILSNNYLSYNLAKKNRAENEKSKKMSSQLKSLMFLEFLDNNKILGINENINNHVVCNTETNLSPVIKVNIKLNKEKDFKLKKKKTLKEAKNEININNKIISNENNYEYNISKILFIQNWWKNYYSNYMNMNKSDKADIINQKAKVFLESLSKIIYRNIMKYFIIHLNNLYYYFMKWYQKISLKKIINKIILIKKKTNNYYSNLTNKKQKQIIHHTKNNKSTTKKVNNNKLYNNNTYKQINYKIKNDDNNSLSKINNSYKITLNSIKKNFHQKKNSDISSFSSRLTMILNNYKNSFEDNNNNSNRLYTDINIKSKNKISYNNKTPCNKEIQKLCDNMENRIGRIKKLNKYSIKKNKKEVNKENGNKNSNNNKNSNINMQKENNNRKINNKSLYINSKVLRQYQSKDFTNKNSHYKRYDLYINDVGNNSNQNTLGILNNINNNKILNTDPNSFNAIITKNNLKNCLTINTSKKKNKINKEKLFKLKKFDTSPLSFKGKKNNLYQKFYVKKCLNYWNKIMIKNKILHNLVKLSSQIKLSKLFYNRFIQILMQTLKILYLKKYFMKYNEITTKNIILKKLKSYILETGYNENNSQRRDIINNININNFINYSRDDINKIIPNMKDEFNIATFDFKSAFPYLNNIKEINIMNTNINIDMNKNKSYNTKNNNNKNQSSCSCVKNDKMPQGILVDQINQLLMVFNLLRQHNNNENGESSILNCFKKWKKMCFEDKGNPIKKEEDKKFCENKENTISNKDIEILCKNHEKKYPIQFYNESKTNRCIKINKKKSLYTARHSYTVRGLEINENTQTSRTNKKIKYIEDRQIVDNSSESMNSKNKLNSEIIYQRKILNYNHISNLSKKVNRIEEREVHFNSLSSNKKVSNIFISNSNNINNNTNNEIDSLYNDNSNNFDNSIKGNRNNTYLRTEINENKQLKTQRENKITHNESNTVNIKEMIYKIHYNKIKNIFSKDKKVANKKVNQTFCCPFVNLENLLDK